MSCLRPSGAAIASDGMSKRSNECVWGCGRADFNVEHVVGRQFARRLGLPYPLALRWAEYGRVQRELEITLPQRVCSGCNGRWMKKLDDRVRGSIGESICSGAPVQIAAAGTKRQLACWAMKVALLLNLWVHDEAVNYPELVESTFKLNQNDLDWLRTSFR